MKRLKVLSLVTSQYCLIYVIRKEISKFLSQALDNHD